ncbi:metallophosphoesterase [Flavobacterium sp. CYK-55]|uniref:metallophosphoesterase n=1 Tax=Flavobacterium sp. CYK-55 TaxID=2835529 RepID=UPI001BD0D180|nr:metallophosphoesterase [Flavobacterium sp. CYK-55]MBS7785911.1 metallophosphoesterase [Flavobacterium sp. CYK-55]
MLFRFLFISFIFLLVEVYAFQALRTLLKNTWALRIYLGLSVLILAFILYSFSQFDRSVGQTRYTLFTLGLMLLVYLPKIVVTLVMLGEDVFRLLSGSVQYFVKSSTTGFLPERRKFISQIGLGLAAVPFLSLIYGMTVGKYNYKVIKQRIFFPDLPDAFDGFTITQISDVHSGSFDNPEKINYAIDLINEQEADMILFTGDIVNTHAKEMHPWIESFNRIKDFKFGKFSVLGNHDYGEYVTWSSPQDKEKNFEDIKNLYSEIGFELLLNENRFIAKDGQRIALVGVENWGRNFKQAGDLNKATKNLSETDFKILMSHDPSHWEYEVKKHPKNIHLTLSGHTHGLQFGIEIPGFLKWSPVQYIYKQWAGLYEEFGRYIYVNRGFGFHAYPGRVGIMPEITVIQLKKGEKLA